MYSACGSSLLSWVPLYKAHQGRLTTSCSHAPAAPWASLALSHELLSAYSSFFLLRTNNSRSNSVSRICVHIHQTCRRRVLPPPRGPWTWVHHRVLCTNPTSGYRHHPDRPHFHSTQAIPWHMPWWYHDNMYLICSSNATTVLQFYLRYVPCQSTTREL
jgi:hypothetical protein